MEHDANIILDNTASIIIEDFRIILMEASIRSDSDIKIKS